MSHENDEHGDYDATEAAGALRMVLRFLGPYLRRHRGALSLLGLGVLIETAYNVAVPLSLKYLIDDALSEQNKRALIWILSVLAILAVVSSTIGFLYEYLNARLGATVLRDIRQRLFEHLQSLSLQFYSRTKVGEVLSRFSTDLGEVEDLVMHGISWGLLPLLELITAVFLLFYLNRQLALAAMLIWPLTLVGPKILSPRVVAATYQKKLLEADTLSVVQENVSAQPVIKVFGLHLIAMNWFRQRIVPLTRTSTRVSFLNAIVERSVNTAVLLLHLLVLGFGAWLTFRKQITIGTLVTFESVFWELSYNTGWISEFIPAAVQAAGSIQHINDLLKEKPRVVDAPNSITLLRPEHEIVFDDVSFSYNGGGPQLKHLNLRIPYGSSVAIVGESGSGKTTLLNLLLRLYQPTEGSVRIDGCDLGKVTHESLLAQMALVHQENILFNTSIRENIRLGKPSATNEEVEAAARAAEIHEFINALPEGYDTCVGEGGGLLSGGQRQRIAIARAIIRSPAILILDEATSALDYAVEAAVVDTLQTLAKGRTVISVTHRLSSVVNADKIFVLDRGSVVDEGSHWELMQRKGSYRRFWEKQISRDVVKASREAVAAI